MEAAEEGCSIEDDLLEQCLGKEEQLSDGLDEKPKGGFDYTTCIPEYDIDLDREPEERWDQVAQDYLEHFPVLKEYSKMCAVVDFGGETLGPLLLGTCGKGLSLSSSFNGMMSADMRRELQGIAKHTESIGMGFEDLLVLNAGYDLLARCTSIVTEGPDGTPMQIRNLDWDLDHLRDLTINCNFKKNGRILYKATMHAGLTGIFTGMRMCSEENPEEGFSLSLNYRKTGGSLSLGYNLLQLMNGGWGIGFFIREALTKMATYQEAVEFLSSGPLMAPCYISIAGIQKGHGALITRDRKGETNRLELSDERPFLLVTNIDHWQDAVDPDWAEGDPLLLNSIERRTAATESIRVLHGRWQEKKVATSGCCLEEFVHSCFEVLGGAPVCNVQTVYSAVLSPAFSLYRIHLLKKPLSAGDALCTEDKTEESI